MTSPVVVRASDRLVLSKGPRHNTFCADCGHLASQHEGDHCLACVKGSPVAESKCEGFREQGEHTEACRLQLGESPPGHAQCYCPRADERERQEPTNFGICGCGHAYEGHHWPKVGSQENFCNRGGCTCNGFAPHVDTPDQLPSDIRDMKIDKSHDGGPGPSWDIHTTNEWHGPDCALTEGKRGAVKFHVQRWRRNGATKTWKTRPGEFRIPIKHGLRDYGYIDHTDHLYYHPADRCPEEARHETALQVRATDQLPADIRDMKLDKARSRCDCGGTHSDGCPSTYTNANCSCSMQGKSHATWCATRGGPRLSAGNIDLGYEHCPQCGHLNAHDLDPIKGTYCPDCPTCKKPLARRTSRCVCGHARHKDGQCAGCAFESPAILRENGISPDHRYIRDTDLARRQDRVDVPDKLPDDIRDRDVNKSQARCSSCGTAVTPETSDRCEGGHGTYCMDCFGKHGDAADGDYQCCPAQSDKAFVCTRPPGHRGDHVAHSWGGKLETRWPQEGMRSASDRRDDGTREKPIVPRLRAGEGGLPRRATPEPSNGARHRSIHCAYGHHDGCKRVFQTHSKHPAGPPGRKMTCDCRCHPSDKLPDDIRDMNIEKGRKRTLDVDKHMRDAHGHAGDVDRMQREETTFARHSWDHENSVMGHTHDGDLVHDRLPSDIRDMRVAKSFEPEEHNESGRYFFPIGCKNCMHNEIAHAVGKRKGIPCDGSPSYCEANVTFKNGKEIHTPYSASHPCEHSSCPENKRRMPGNGKKMPKGVKCACPGFDGGFKGDAFAKPKDYGQEHDIGGFKLRVGQTLSGDDMKWMFGKKIKPGINVIRGHTKLKVKVPDKLPKNFGKATGTAGDGNPFVISSRRARLGLFWHGTPSGEVGSGDAKYGLHVGTKRAALQALNARIGTPAKGNWDGKREYGKTPLGGGSTGYNSDHKPGLADGSAEYSDGTKVPLDAKPNLVPVKITGPMTNSPFRPHDDFRANGMMAGQKKRGTAKRGYYYRNRGEDEGSVSAVVPGAQHVLRLRKSGDYCGADSDESPEVFEEKLSHDNETRSPKNFATTCRAKGSYSGLLSPTGKVYARPGYQEHENMTAGLQHDEHSLVNNHGWARLSAHGRHMNIDINHDAMSRDTAANVHQIATTHGQVDAWTCYGRHRGGWEMGRDAQSLAEHLEEEASKKSFAKGRPHARDHGEWNGKRFWSGSVSRLDGKIEEVHPYRTAEQADFHHQMYFSPGALERMDHGESNFFWMQDHGKGEGPRAQVEDSFGTSNGTPIPKHERDALIDHVHRQVKVHP